MRVKLPSLTLDPEGAQSAEGVDNPLIRSPQFSVFIFHFVKPFLWKTCIFFGGVGETY